MDLRENHRQKNMIGVYNHRNEPQNYLGSMVDHSLEVSQDP